MQMMNPFQRRLLAATASLSVLLVAAFAVAAYSFVAGHRTACQARNTTLGVMSSILIAAQQQTDGDPTIAPAKKAQSDLFVTQALTRIADARC